MPTDPPACITLLGTCDLIPCRPREDIQPCHDQGMDSSLPAIGTEVSLLAVYASYDEVH